MLTARRCVLKKNYAENLKQALIKDLRALGCEVQINDVSVKERPDGDYAVEVRVHTARVETPEGLSADVGSIVSDTYAQDEAVESRSTPHGGTARDAYKEKTRRLAKRIRRA